MNIVSKTLFSQTLFAAWHNGALSNSYLTNTLEKMSEQMKDIESHHLAPPGWRAVWDRYDLFRFIFHSDIFSVYKKYENTKIRLPNRRQDPKTATTVALP